MTLWKKTYTIEVESTDFDWLCAENLKIALNNEMTNGQIKSVIEIGPRKLESKFSDFDLSDYEHTCKFCNFRIEPDLSYATHQCTFYEPNRYYGQGNSCEHWELQRALKILDDWLSCYPLTDLTRKELRQKIRELRGIKHETNV